MEIRTTLDEYQLDALSRMKNGCILCGGVGSGKSRVSLSYYYICNGGKIFGSGHYPMIKRPQDLYIITTAKKRDTYEWEKEMIPFLLSPNEEENYYKNSVTIDSWNNIKKYAEVKDAFFIFDEQRVVGKGAWVKAFLKIAKANNWILLSATPGDTWADYIPVFIANGFYKNRTEFSDRHIVYARAVKYPKIDRYLDTGRLIKLRNDILIEMDFQRETTRHDEHIYCEYDRELYKLIHKKRFNIYEDKPIRNASEFCYVMRKIVNSDLSRLTAIEEIMRDKKRAIIFYSFDYELELLKSLDLSKDYIFAEWNGHKHQEIPKSDCWIYLVQYTSGCEGWNCIKTDTIIFYSQQYSYRVLEQAKGRIDRRNTMYKDLYYYHLKSRASIDLMINRALAAKKNFNERTFAKFE